MINNIYRLIAPRNFRIEAEEIDLNRGLVVRPTLLSICKADQRYYCGDRSPKVLANKLPMALIHEACGEVLYDPLQRYQAGTVLSLIPNLPPEDIDVFIAENYIEGVRFRGSSMDGFLSEYVAIPHDRVIPVESIKGCTFTAFLELASVAVHAIRALIKAEPDLKGKTVGIWGDGSLGYIAALLTKHMCGCTVFVIGKNTDKLAYFSFADDCFLVNEFRQRVDHAFELVGGSKSAIAIEQIISYILPAGQILLGGASEHPIPVNTRMVLEKGLTLLGFSRSGYGNFHEAIQLIQQSDALQEHLENLVSSVVEVDSVASLSEAFQIDRNNQFKTVIRWNV